jgi:hypothetical protein
MANEQPAFTRFFRSVKGKLAPRYGTASPQSPNLLIGATQTQSGPVWDTTVITPITEREALRFAREYNRLVKEGALVEVKPAEYEAQRAVHLERKKEAARAAAKEAAAAKASTKATGDKPVEA